MKGNGGVSSGASATAGHNTYKVNPWAGKYDELNQIGMKRL